jgi:hypothetical protein
MCFSIVCCCAVMFLDYNQAERTGRSNFQLIEHQVRKGKKYLKTLSMDGVDGFSLASLPDSK